MDLKSMLNDSSSQRQPPRLHTPQSSYDQAAVAVHTPAYDPLERTSSHPQPLPSSDYRSSANGSYFAIQSPHQQHSAPAFTPSVTGQSMYAQSPGPHGQIHTPREGVAPPVPYQQPAFVPSPSPSALYPSTPGSVHHQTPTSATAQLNPGPHTAFTHPSPREEFTPANDNVRLNTQTLSPQAQFHPPPVTPLGPPSSYTRPSPHPNRPISQGQDNYRRLSVSSVGSTHSREYNQGGYAHASHSRSGSVQRTYSGDVRERERSIESVSPKTIPKPPPRRESSGTRYQELFSEGPQSAQPTFPMSTNSQSGGTPDRSIEVQHHETTPKSVSTPADSRIAAQYPGSNPGAMNNLNTTPPSTHSSLPPQASPMVAGQPGLKKRSASHISSLASTPQPPRKRPRRDFIPLHAQSARHRPPKFIKAPPVVVPRRDDPVIKTEPHVSNGQARLQSAPPAQTTPPVESVWEPSITTLTPYEDLTRRMCDWIYSVIGEAAPPPGGAVFEIEAKIGCIYDEHANHRLSLPVDTETWFSRERYRGKTSFMSSMNMIQHELLNKFLNNLVEESVRESQTSGRAVIGYSHPHEYDEFYELTDDGRKNLAPWIVTWLNPRHKPRVRRTIDENSGMVKAQIIKSRIADVDVYNPRTDFDYRVSISIESPWDGDPNWLTEMADSGRDRQKDRMSYRHMAYQIDLTQVSYPNRVEKEHELEVEISTEQIRIQLANAREGRPSRYEEMVKGFLDNVRILCRQGSVRR
ncbi:hypothetical protein PV08_09623 [Exophiala spinifera]|uniref:mRNA-capping enzyme subunit beta n=1 Tax=Exophiala spinifera TaxID=91928 RepID=A0A0D1YBM3_9EURO|nr:uncharacterized protein PV08_09623 [Exophiala spinifera]KIW12346.1 hypothetical protein PV08_09623 [Exophiala spinifera]